jgi:hypothetical protein
MRLVKQAALPRYQVKAENLHIGGLKVVLMPE